MAEIIVLAEHRMGELRDVTFEMLSKGRELAEEAGLELAAVLLGYEAEELAEKLRAHAPRVLVYNHPELAHFNSDCYQRVMAWLMRERKPKLTLIGHTSYGIDLAPSLAVELGAPLATDCIDLRLGGGRAIVTRQVYGGKLNVEASLRESDSYIVTVRPAVFEGSEPGPMEGDVIDLEYPHELAAGRKRFVGYVEPQPGEVDISDAEIVVSVGRGIKDEKNIGVIVELAGALRGEVGCSRPVVDKGWLPKERQVGSSGKTVKPKLYIATGISGSFQHVMGMKGSDLIVAINKDPKAPIFRISDYGVVEDLFKLVPALTQKINELKQSS